MLALFGALSSAQAADVAAGAKVFNNNCTACHANGGNVMSHEKTLKKEALEKEKMNSVVAIVTKVAKGGNGMPGFDGQLKAVELENVAAYILEQAKKDWK
jgi:cytochrome c6